MAMPTSRAVARIRVFFSLPGVGEGAGDVAQLRAAEIEGFLVEIGAAALDAVRTIGDVALLDDVRLDEDEQLLAGAGLRRIREEVLQQRDAAEENDAFFAVVHALGDEAAEDDGGAVLHGDFGDEFLRADGGDGVSRDDLAADDVVIRLGDAQGDFVIVRPNSGTRLKIHGREFRIINDDSVEGVVEDPRGISRA